MVKKKEEKKTVSEPEQGKKLGPQKKASTGPWWKTVIEQEPQKSGADIASKLKEGKKESGGDKTVKDKKEPSARKRPIPPAKRGRRPSGRKKKPFRPELDQVVKKSEDAEVAVPPTTELKEKVEETSLTSTEAKKEPVKQPREKEKQPSKARASGRKRGGKPKEADKEKTKVVGKKEELEEKGKKTSEEKVTEKVAETERAESKVITKLLINAEEPEECRIALLEDGRLESIYVSTVGREQTKNNIYKARIVAIEPSLQAVFVDYGTAKNGFLPFAEIHPEYYKPDLSDESRQLVEKHQWKKLSIRDVLERGQELLVQVVKEEVGSKGANMTTYLSIPGRCVVLMPGSDSTGISRKISGEEKRSQLRDIMRNFEIPEGIGWIVRTASEDITKTALGRDVRYLLKLWEDIKTKGQNLEGVGLLYKDHDCVLRFLREHFDPDIKEILVDDKAALEQVKDFIELLPAKQKQVVVRLHKGTRPIFNQYSVEDQIESIYQPKVNLPSGGSIVINPTEALVAIDVNSGSTSKGKNFEASIFLANMEAAAELARQLRLRDLGGLVVVDFIDMRSRKNIIEVEKRVKTAMKRDKAKVDISRISKFGLMQISRQKMGSPIEVGNYRVCQHCQGRGMVRSVETLALFYLRRIQTGATRNQVQKVECYFPLDVAQYLLNNKRQELRDLEIQYKVMVDIIPNPTMKPADNEILFLKGEKEVK